MTAQPDEAPSHLYEQIALLERIELLNRTFTEAVLSGIGLQAVLDPLAAIVGKPVVFDDFTRNLVAYACTPDTTEAQLIERWERHRSQMHGTKGSDTCIWSVVSHRDEEWGRIHIFTKDGEEDAFDTIAIERAATYAAICLLTLRESTTLIDTARSEFIADLWQGRKWREDVVIARTRSVGGDIEQPQLVGVAIQLAQETAGAPHHRRALSFALDKLQRGANKHANSCMAAVVDSTCLGIIGLTVKQAQDNVIETIAKSVLHDIEQEFGSQIIAIGVSREGTSRRLRKLLTEATDAARHGAENARTSGVYRSSDLGLLSLLGNLAETPELRRFVDDELEALLDHDANSGSPLIPTLRALLECGGQKTQAAKKLHVDRRSLYYRLERIEELCDVDLDSAVVRLRLQVALQGLDVLRTSSAVSRA